MKLESPIAIPVNHFQNHLSNDENERVLFSGKFGIGKTWFLNEFFEINKEDYVKIHLYPVNYAVTANKDIFELIKVDIIFEILRQQLVDFEAPIFEKSLILQQYISNKYSKIASFLFDNSTNIGQEILDSQDQENIKIVTGIIKLLNKVCDASDYKKYEKEIQGNLDLKTIKEFFDSKMKEIGNLYEYNFITQLLVELVDKIKGEDRKVVLVIDDLDRIDPEHVFRILNVFSAHFDQKDNSNKFGFDKIVFVCDINNLKSIFSHKYGIGTDFE